MSNEDVVEQQDEQDEQDLLLCVELDLKQGPRRPFGRGTYEI